MSAWVESRHTPALLSGYLIKPLWFLEMMREHEEFVVETDRAGELPMPFWSETVRRVVVASWVQAESYPGLRRR